MRPKPITLLLATPLICASALAAILPASAQQSPPQQSQAQQIPADATRPGNPRLADLMEATQARHIKLWFAGVTANWKLAAYQTRQIKARLQEAASLYDSLPVSDVTTMAKPLDAVSSAIAAQDSKAFAKAYAELTTGCNSCHRELKLGFIELKTPEMNPFADQVFGVKKK